MIDIELQLPESLHNRSRQLAQEEGISLNQLITLALAEKVSALRTESHLAARAARGDRTKFEAAMSRVADVEPPDKRDRL